MLSHTQACEFVALSEHHHSQSGLVDVHAWVCSGLIRATLHMVNREFGELAADFISLGLLPPGADRDAIVPALTSAHVGLQGSTMPQHAGVPRKPM